jgi:hypothetical protein
VPEDTLAHRASAPARAPRIGDRLRPAERDTHWTDPRPRSEAELLRLLREALADPSPYDTAEAFSKFHHDDLPNLALDDIDRERLRLRIFWAFLGLTEWGAQRLAVLDREAARRRKEPRG